MEFSSAPSSTGSDNNAAFFSGGGIFVQQQTSHGHGNGSSGSSSSSLSCSIPFATPIFSLNSNTSYESSAGYGNWIGPTLHTFQSHAKPSDVKDHTNGGSNGDDALTINQLLSRLTRAEDNIDKKLQWLEFQGNKRKRQDDDWLDKLKDLKKRAIDVKNSLHQSGSTNEFPEPYELGDEFDELLLMKPWMLLDERDENMEKMWDLLEHEEVLIIGIDGMGGVGKTFMATHFKNEIKRKGTFKDVFWVTVFDDFTTFKLQHDIAATIQVKLYGDEMTRATILTLELEKRGKTLLILDDVWEYIDLQKVGIPLKVNGIKLIITTRLKHVCLQMDCLPNNIIRMHPLSGEEAWELFLLKLGHRGTPARLPPHVLEIARSVVMKCDGLQLGISVMARTMKGKNEIYWWRHALNILDRLEMGEEVLSVLKRSYDNLIEKDIQKCFLRSALFPNETRKEEWVMMVVESGGTVSLFVIFQQA
ncbi:putative disease resistance protein [Glycine max]|uniref:probable disease resistance protein At1g61300 n=1 Tax=Glycine max TaxID=3847 RepID=UPI0003DEBD4A|nr:probable disease resistance protein At1g61300 [Glycine max]KAH1213981.1 putative disease resistance protein [Glycine max]|eukprot:XP_006596864.1 probable disease resistance protein At1g61300 [Glycine max]